MLLIMWLKWRYIHNNDLSWWNVITKHCYLIVDRSVNILGLKPEILLVGKNQKVAVKNNCIANKAYTFTYPIKNRYRLCSPCHSKITYIVAWMHATLLAGQYVWTSYHLALIMQHACLVSLLMLENVSGSSFSAWLFKIFIPHPPKLF